MLPENTGPETETRETELPPEEKAEETVQTAEKENAPLEISLEEDLLPENTGPETETRETELSPEEKAEETVQTAEKEKKEDENIENFLLETFPEEMKKSQPENEPILQEDKTTEENIDELLRSGEEFSENSSEVPTEKMKKEQKLANAFNLDLLKNTAEIELSIAEYSDLLKEFIRDSRIMKNDLLSDDASKRKEAVTILKDAITLLHLDPLDQLIEDMEHANDTEKITLAEDYDLLLDKLEDSLEFLDSMQVGIKKETKSFEETGNEPNPFRESENEEPQKQPLEPEKEIISEKKEEEVENILQSVSIDEFLKSVIPIPIEFSVHIAAEELNLPEDLVLEFISDFAKQGHEYLPVLIETYQKGELDRLQKTAHMLKGAASNLRIEAMVENLYELQFDNNISRAPDRIRLFAGQLMSLDKYLQQKQMSS